MKKKSIKIMMAGLLAVPLMAISAGLFIPTNLVAADDYNIKTATNSAQPSNVPNNLTGTSGVFTTVVNILLFIIGAIAVIMLIYGGIRYTISGGDSKNVTAAKDTILYAIVGIVVAILAYAIVNFVINGLIQSP
jgi:multisubunit Na+/H+ antiporter MnhB subunit